MHTIFQNILRWRDERHRKIMAEHQIERLNEEYGPQIAKVKRRPWNDYHRLLDELRSELQFPEGEIDQIDTARRLRAARRFSVPIPKRPEDGEEDEYWHFSPAYGHVLTELGHQLLRHEIAHERELRERPVIAWLALAAGGLGLIIHLLNFFFR